MPATFVPPPAAPADTLAGVRCALILCAVLLAGLALLTGARWLGSGGLPGGGHETVIQQPVGPNDFIPDHPAATAPEPAADL